MKPYPAVGALAAALVLGCATTSEPSEATMNQLASSVTKLSAAVDSAVRYRGAPPSLTEKELLGSAASADPSVLAPFSGYTLRVRRIGEEVAVLVCQAGSGRPLLEDAGCTARMDLHRWRTSGEVCDFTLDLAQVCKP